MSELIADHAFKPFEYDRLNTCLHDSFRESASRNGNHRAICDPEYDFTYNQLDTASDFIARQLLDASQGGGTKTALLLNQGVLLGAAILGVLKSGGIYVPLDPGHPESWNASILTDSGCSSILTSGQYAGNAGRLAETGIDVLGIDASCADYSGPVVSAQCDPDHVACIYYTSGSTGRPKGVCDTHRSILHNIMRYTNALHISGSDCLSLIQSPVFSGTLSSLFGALLNGASIASLDIRRRGLDVLPAWIGDQGVTVFHSVPAIFRTLAVDGISYPTVRVIRLEGDRSSDRDFRIFKRHFSDSCVLANGLGATECGLVRQYVMDKNSAVPRGVLPLGYTVQDMELLILDKAGLPVKQGKTGEIAVRSRYLAEGYLNQQALTDERFLAPVDGSDCRIYLTGDLGSVDENDCLYFHGRKDQRVKVNGQYVEVAPIESALGTIMGVHEAVVQVRVDDPDNPCVTGYLVADEDIRPSLETIRSHLASLLPMHLIPTRLIWLDSIPLTPDHKIDRAALPPPPRERPSLATRFVAPRDVDEVRLAEIWEDLLSVSPVGVYDSFFDLGGDSLRATLLVSRINAGFDVAISIAAIFESPTVEGLCKEIRAQSYSSANQNPAGPG